MARARRRRTVVAGRAFRLLVGTLCLTSAAPSADAQVGWLGKIARAGRAAGAARTVAFASGTVVLTTEAAGLADRIADAARLGRTATVPLSGPARGLRGLSVEDAAAAVLGATGDAASGTRLYLGIEDGGHVLVGGPAFATWRPAPSSSGGPSIAERVARLMRDGELPDGPVQLIVEADAFTEAGLARAALPPGSEVLIAAADGPPIPTRLVATANGAERMIAIRPGLVARAGDVALLGPVRSLFRHRLDRDGVRVAAAFDEVADEPTLAALRAAIADRATVSVIASETDLVRALDAARGRTLALVAHLEAGADGARVVVLDKHSRPRFSIPLARLEAMAEARRVALVPLGCETALHGALGGFLRRVWGGDVATQLGQALAGPTWGDFFAALGTEAHPLMLAPRLADGTLTVVARQVEGRALRYSTRVAIPPRLLAAANRSTMRAEQTFAFLPGWWDTIATFGLGIGLLGVLGGLLARSPRFAGRAVILSLAIALLPVAVPVAIALFIIGGRAARAAPDAAPVSAAP